MKVFNHKQLHIILKPKFNCPIICKLIINQLKKYRFKHKQQKLFNNLLIYKINYSGKWYNRFQFDDLFHYKTSCYINDYAFDNITTEFYELTYNSAWGEDMKLIGFAKIFSLYWTIYCYYTYNESTNIKFIK